MQLPITITLAALSAGALALPSNVIDGTIPPANRSDTRNGLPYSNFNPSNSTLSSEAFPPDNHSANHLDNPRHHHHHEHANESSNTTTLLRRTDPRFGNIASYSDGDCTVNTTKLHHIKDRTCQTFEPAGGDFIGINWGSGLGPNLQYLQVYTSPNCDHPVKLDPPLVTPGSLGMSKAGAGKCYSYQHYLQQGGKWVSMLGE